MVLVAFTGIAWFDKTCSRLRREDGIVRVEPIVNTITLEALLRPLTALQRAGGALPSAVSH